MATRLRMTVRLNESWTSSYILGSKRGWLFLGANFMLFELSHALLTLFTSSVISGTISAFIKRYLEESGLIFVPLLPSLLLEIVNASILRHYREGD